MRRHPHLAVGRVITGLFLLASMAAHAPANAVLLQWNNPAGGSAATPGNWTPNGLPGPGDQLSFELAAQYSVFFPTATVSTVGSHDYRAGVVNLASDGTHTMTGYLSIGFSGRAGVNLTGGTIEVQSLVLGDQGSATYGRLTLDPGASPTAPPPILRLTRIFPSCRCLNGRLEVLGGSSLIGQHLEFAASPDFVTPRCTLIVAGRSDLVSQTSSATFASTGLIGWLGTALVRLDDGGYLRISGPTYIGPVAYSDGTVRVGTQTTTLPPAFDAMQELRIGDTDPPCYEPWCPPPSHSGQGVVHLAQGVIRVGGRTSLGNPLYNIGVPELRIDGGTFIAGGGFTRRNGTAFTHTGGILHVAGGTVEWPGTLRWDVDGTPDRPELWIGTGTTSSINGPLSVGKAGHGVLRVIRPGTRFKTAGQIRLAELPGGTGEMVVDSSAVAVVSDLFVGPQGVGTLAVRGGGRVESRAVSVGGDQPASQGDLIVSGLGSVLSCENSLFLGSLISGPITGTATVEAQGVIEVTQPNSFVEVHDGGRLVVRESGAVQAPDVFARGRIEVADGVLQGATDISATGTLRGHGDVVGSLMASGVVDPAPSTGTFGTLRVWGPTTFTASARLPITLGRDTGPRNDSLSVTGALTLGGTLDLIADASFTPIVGDTFVIATASAVFGGFGDVTWNGAPVAGQFQVVIQPAGRVIVLVHGVVDVEPLTDGPAELRFTAFPGAAFSLALPDAASVRVTLHDVMGRLVNVIHDGALPAGTHRLRAPAALPGSGVYFARAAVTREGRTDVRTVKALRFR